MRLLTCTICAGWQEVSDERPDACVRCGTVAWIDFPIWPDDEPAEWPADPTGGQTFGTISTLYRYDGSGWVPVARRPRGTRP